ncbi:MAG TPA: DNA repair exonuclease [Longimicrobiaceae bacterium]|nr:DNA repair exonuclease [Longimicrobiaceae bacterium]
MPRPFRFVHAADLHIDSRFVAWSGAPESVRQTLLESTHRAFRNLVDLCIKREAAFLVIAGDVFDCADRGVRAQLRFRDGLAELAARGIQSFVVHGNHDPLDGWASSISFPPEVKVFGPDPEWAMAMSGGQPLAQVQGASYPTQETKANLAARFSEPNDPDLFSVGLLHCNLGGNPEHANYAPCTVSDLEAPGIDYWALGHIHKRQIVRPLAPAIVYAGNIQGRDIGETGSRGCYVVDVDESRYVKPEFVALDVVRWARTEIPVGDASNFDEVVGALDRQISDLRAGSEGRSLVCRVALTGRGPIHEELARSDTAEQLLAHVRDTFVADEPWVWLDGLDDRTMPDLDIGQRASEQDFLGLLLTRAAAEMTGPALRAELARDLNASLRTSRDREWAEQLSEAEMAGLIDRTRWLLAERLEAQDR